MVENFTDFGLNPSIDWLIDLIAHKIQKSVDNSKVLTHLLPNSWKKIE